MSAHRCDVPGCDGTRLGHDLAAEFPDETRRCDEALDELLDRIRNRPAPTTRTPEESPDE